ncbi:uncharacterized protein [Onthophagus taurus]|uniref:uncharacterized protein n=1 Tax=Onthophagus taurus TaxID=166361 RepID=UPI000C208BAA|nr:uncharacterized protein LOC111423788 [Onthophagus taurus]
MPEEKGNENKETNEGDEDDLYSEPKSKPKLIRILTVFAYMSSVSMAAILLSIYYIFMWEGQPSLARRTDPRMESMIGHSSMIREETQLEQNKSDAANIEEFTKNYINVTFDSLKTERERETEKDILTNDVTQGIQQDNKKERNLNEPLRDTSGGNCTTN